MCGGTFHVQNSTLASVEIQAEEDQSTSSAPTKLHLCPLRATSGGTSSWDPSLLFGPHLSDSGDRAQELSGTFTSQRQIWTPGHHDFCRFFLEHTTDRLVLQKEHADANMKQNLVLF